MAEERLPLPERVLVTGAAGGIGGAILRRLAGAGTAVVATDRTLPADPGGAASWIATDLTHAEGRAAIVQAVRDGPPLGGVVHAAGAIDPAGWDSVHEAAAQQVLAVNLVAPFFLLRDLLPALAPGASVVLLGSIAGVRAAPLTAFYAAAKAGLRSLGASLSVELAPRGIRVNVLAPGLIDTPLTDALNDRLAQGRTPAEVMAQRVAAIPMGRAGTPEEVASACLFLLSPAASYVAGATLFATGAAAAGGI